MGHRAERVVAVGGFESAGLLDTTCVTTGLALADALADPAPPYRVRMVARGRLSREGRRVASSARARPCRPGPVPSTADGPPPTGSSPRARRTDTRTYGWTRRAGWPGIPSSPRNARAARAGWACTPGWDWGRGWENQRSCVVRGSAADR
ncbi:hypothetical protein ABZ618_25585 [Streptomyces roseolus]|uniref:hypothetical protein n=1 Tax=Streptomyces roseolus TaxID=67358 RepID=UPI0033D7529C